MTTQPSTPVLDQLGVTFGAGITWAPEGSSKSGTFWESQAYILLWWPHQSDTDTQLSQVWQTRKGRQPLPVVLLAPANDSDAIRVVGPQENRPVRQLAADRVVQLLADSRDKRTREAASFLSREFARLEEAVVPGINVKDLLTPHFVRDRLMWQENKGKLEDATKEANIPRDGAWQPLFRALGFADERLQRGYLLRHNGAPIAVVHPYNDAQQFSRLTDSGELPEGQVLADCESHGARWGILTAQGRHRVFFREPPVGAATSQYFEINIGELRPEDRLYVGLLSPKSLEANGWLTDWVREAKDFGEKLRQGLEERLIKDALPNIARGLGEYLEMRGADLSDREQLREIQEAALTLVFRFMFLLHTEARGYLPVNSPAYRPKSATALADDCRKNLMAIDDRSSTRWNQLRVLVGMVRTGDTTAGVPAYNGSLFAAEGFPGSALLESAEIKDSYLMPALAAIAFDTTKNDSSGLDYAGLDVGHLGAIYEKLLSYRLMRAPEDLTYDKTNGFFRPPRAGEQSGVTRAQLYFQAEAGGRKSGGVYYTRREFVDHLLNNSLMPALEGHLRNIEELAPRDPAEAARRLFDFSVVDPAMGSAHFLTVALDKMADRIATFLSDIDGLPTIAREFNELAQDAGPVPQAPEVADLLKRLILKRCIYGVDISPMAVEVANVTLWLESFVPGLSLSWLGSNLKCGDALIGVADPGVVGEASTLLTGQPVKKAMKRAAELQQQLAANPDRTPEEVKRSEQLSEELREATVGLRAAFDMWAAEPLGLEGARHALETSVGAIIGQDQQKMDVITDEIAESSRLAKQYRFFHWPLEFPSIFHDERPGFDVVVGNPPWEEVTIEELAFYALREPGLRGVIELKEQQRRIARMDQENPELRLELQEEVRDRQRRRRFLGKAGGYTMQGTGDTDLHKLFSERYGYLVRSNGHFGVVLPHGTFLNNGSSGFREWLYQSNSIIRLDIIRNDKGWAFPIHKQTGLVLLAAQRKLPSRDWELTTTGPSRTQLEFADNTKGGGIGIPKDIFTQGWETPVVPSQQHVDILVALKRSLRLKQFLVDNNTSDALRGAGRSSRLILSTDLHETNDRRLFRHSSGQAVWKGRSFGAYEPHGKDPAGYADWPELIEHFNAKRKRSGLMRPVYTEEELEDPSTLPIYSARIAFMDTTNAIDYDTIVACLVPPRTPLGNTAPFVLSHGWHAHTIGYLLGVLNSLAFDWQARRYVKLHASFYIMNDLSIPDWDQVDWHRIGTLAAELSCVDERFKDFAEEAGVAWGLLTEAVRNDKRAEIDALVARAYGLTEDDLSFIFKDFTENAVTPAYRQLVLEKFRVAEAANWLGDTGGSAPDMENIPRRRGELA